MRHPGHGRPAAFTDRVWTLRRMHGTLHDDLPSSPRLTGQASHAIFPPDIRRRDLCNWSRHRRGPPRMKPPRFSSRGSARCSSSTATSAIRAGRSRPRAACAWTAAKPCCGAVATGRRSCPASPTTACSSRRSATKATSRRCPRTRNCRIGYSPTFAGGSPRVRPTRARRAPAATTPAGGDVASGPRCMGLPTAAIATRPHRCGTRRGPGMSWIGSSSPGSKRRNSGRPRTPIATPGFAGSRSTWSACRRRPSRSSRSSMTRRPWPGSASSIDFWRHRRSASAGRRHWLDLTGYADQIGTANDIFAEHAWRYRDYVIAAFNADKPVRPFHPRAARRRLAPLRYTPTSEPAT